MQPDPQLAPRVLVAAGDAGRRAEVAMALRSSGFSVSATTDASAALLLNNSFAPDVIVIDLQMQHPAGGALFDSVRATTNAYLIAVASQGDDLGTLRALRAGADDVVSVSIPVDELAARCQALLRRPRAVNTRWDPLDATELTLGPLTVDVGRREVRLLGRPIATTRHEFDLFEQLCRRPSEVHSRAQLLRGVWGPTWYGDHHVVDVHISNLRRKFEARAPGIAVICNVRGIGFRLASNLADGGPTQRSA